MHTLGNKCNTCIPQSNPALITLGGGGVANGTGYQGKLMLFPHLNSHCLALNFSLNFFSFSLCQRRVSSVNPSAL